MTTLPSVAVIDLINAPFDEYGRHNSTYMPKYYGNRRFCGAQARHEKKVVDSRQNTSSRYPTPWKSHTESLYQW